METKNIHSHASWLASHSNSEQTRALIKCQQLKIIQLLELIELIKGEIELTEVPREFSDEMILSSVRELVNNIPNVSCVDGYFKWKG